MSTSHVIPNLIRHLEPKMVLVSLVFTIQTIPFLTYNLQLLKTTKLLMLIVLNVLEYKCKEYIYS